MILDLQSRRTSLRKREGAVLVIVLWIAFGLVTVALYFGQSMALELRAADNRSAAVESQQAIEGVTRYVKYILANVETNGFAPNPDNYKRENVPIGDATYWLIGRSINPPSTADQLTFGLVDESSKLNLNTATLDMLEMLPNMTPELAAAIIDWRDTDTTPGTGGAEDETYSLLNPAYHAKNLPFDTTDELRLVYGADLQTLYGEDTNLNGILDPNENDGEDSPPTFDNRDGKLDSGLFEYVTVYSRQPNTDPLGSNAVNVALLGTQQGAADMQLFTNLLNNAGIQNLTPRQITGTLGNRQIGSILEFYYLMQNVMKFEDFVKIEPSITVSNAQQYAFIEGLVNVNTASETVLACIPGIGVDYASALVSYRQSSPDRLGSVAWVVEVLPQANCVQAGPFLGSRSYQYTADIAAVGHFGRGYRREKVVFDTSEMDPTVGTINPKIIHRQDLSHMGWALGKDVKQTILTANQQ